MATADYEVASVLSSIASQIATVGTMIGTLNTSIAETEQILDNHIETSHDSIADLIRKFNSEFTEFTDIQKKANRLQVAETRIVKIRQELEKKFGHYDIVRRTLTGIMQADDLNIVKSSTMLNTTEELMISTPNYWLAPALVALASWINDDQEVAKRALKEAINRDDTKTSLMFALICRRANRTPYALKWINRYLKAQDAKKLGRETVIILDAYTSGLFGNDPDGVVISQITQWIDSLGVDSNFKSNQIQNWASAILNMKQPLSDDKYPTLQKYAPEYPEIKESRETASINPQIKNYFEDIFKQENESPDSLKKDLDGLLNKLVSDYDNEELPLRESERLEQLVIKYEGDEKEAVRKIEREKTAFNTEKDFTQILVDAALNPELVHARRSTRKFAVSLSKEWIKNAYNVVISRYQKLFPKQFTITLENYKGTTIDGSNEEQMKEEFISKIHSVYLEELKACQMTGFAEFALPGGIVILIAGIAAIIFGIIVQLIPLIPFGVIAGIIGIAFMIHNRSSKRKEREGMAAAKSKFEEKKKNGSAILRSFISEVVDLRREMKEYDKVSNEVIARLETIRPDQYVKTLATQSSIVREMEGMHD